MSDTPRTDAALAATQGMFRASAAANGFADHARTLERELAVAQSFHRVAVSERDSERHWIKLIKEQHQRELMNMQACIESAVAKRNAVEADNRELRSLLLRLHSARVAMNEPAVKTALDDIDLYLREPDTN